MSQSPSRISANGLFPPSEEFSTWLDPDAQDALFEQTWPRLQRSFFKLEALQHYREEGVPIYEAWQRGEQEEVNRLAGEQAREQAEDPVERRIRSVRIRLLALPVTDYVRFESELYRHLSAAGEQILGIEETSAEAALDCRLMDFLLMDDLCVFVHDHEPDGTYKGSWVVEEDEVVSRYQRVADALIDISRPFDALVREYF